MKPQPKVPFAPIGQLLENVKLRMNLCQSRFVQALRTNLVLVVLVMVHFGVVTSINLAIGVPPRLDVVSMLIGLFATFIPIFLVVLLLWKAFTIAVFVHPRRPARRLLSDIRAIILDPFRIFNGIFALVSIGILNQSYAALKVNIDLINPFSWDATFASIDRMLHFNYDPYEVLMPILGTPVVTQGNRSWR